jgi:hypothetical protein
MASRVRSWFAVTGSARKPFNPASTAVVASR